ncbi:MAG: calcium-translocating P-type ATPase, PMCA-type [Planctomycetota bacterium]|jgi:Ca2+-transporting ATPase|nr:calcium-translocating P-type ATPase, PMCA-type [Planctomycetota bacterium]
MDPSGTEVIYSHPGLSKAEVEESRRLYGDNLLTPPERDPWWRLYLDKFRDPIIRVLLIAAVVAIVAGAAEGNYAEGIGIVIAILLATTLAFVNEYRAGREFDILNRVSDDEPVKVIRGGGFTTVPKRDLVVGDIVSLELGEEAPVDGRVISAVSFQVNESSLTGESEPVTKRPATGADSIRNDHAYPRNLVLRGTFVADGHAVVRATAVGDRTEIGKTSRAAQESVEVETPLNRQLSRLGKTIGVFGFGVAALLFVALTARAAWRGGPNGLDPTGGQWYFLAVAVLSVMCALLPIWLPVVYDALDLAGVRQDRPAWLCGADLAPWLRGLAAGILLFALGVGGGVLAGALPSAPGEWLPRPAAMEILRFFMVSVTIIVVAVPEGLPMSVTLSLAYSMRKMTAANNLVRRMHACETIGAATVICSDKTGTLTMNEMRVATPSFAALEQDGLDGSGGELVAEAMAGNSTANLGKDADGELTVPLGNPTECALLLWLRDNGIDYRAARRRFHALGQLTFSTERKFMATAGGSRGSGRETIHLKGAPEIVLGRVASRREADGSVVQADEAFRAALMERLRAEQARGMRTLGFAYRNLPAGSVPEDPSADWFGERASEGGFVWLGFVAIADPVRPEVPDAVAACAKAGIEVKMLTGDTQVTAREIARSIGLWGEGDADDRVVTGDQFAKMDDAGAEIAAERIRIMSRARPLAKQRLVSLLQKRGEVVAVTGDGTNDAPALNHADVGLAMGKTGTSVAKGAADIILLDDSFASIVKAVMWGRSLYANIQKFILFQLTINLAALGIALLGPFLGIKMPLTVTQMLWVNLIMDTFAALALASEPPDWSLMNNPPRRPDAFIVTPVMGRLIFITAGAFLALFLVVALGLGNVFPMDEATGIGRRNLSIFFGAFVLLQFWNLFNARALGNNRSAFSGLSKSKPFLFIAVVIAVGQVLLTQYGGELFRTAPLSAGVWAAILAGTSVVLWVGELARWTARRRASGASGSAQQPGGLS